MSCPPLKLHGLRQAMLPILHYLLEFAHIHVQWISDAIQPSHLLLPPSPPALNLSQPQGLFQWVSSSHQVVKVLEPQLFKSALWNSGKVMEAGVLPKEMRNKKDTTCLGAPQDPARFQVEGTWILFLFHPQAQHIPVSVPWDSSPYVSQLIDVSHCQVPWNPKSFLSPSFQAPYRRQVKPWTKTTQTTQENEEKQMIQWWPLRNENSLERVSCFHDLEPGSMPRPMEKTKLL